MINIAYKTTKVLFDGVQICTRMQSNRACFLLNSDSNIISLIGELYDEATPISTSQLYFKDAYCTQDELENVEIIDRTYYPNVNNMNAYFKYIDNTWTLVGVESLRHTF